MDPCIGVGQSRTPMKMFNFLYTWAFRPWIQFTTFFYIHFVGRNIPVALSIRYFFYKFLSEFDTCESEKWIHSQGFFFGWFTYYQTLFELRVSLHFVFIVYCLAYNEKCLTIQTLWCIECVEWLREISLTQREIHVRRFPVTRISQSRS